MDANTVSKGIPDTTAVVRNHGLRTLDGARLLTKCEVLDVSENQLTNFFGMITLPRLRCLHAENNKIESFAGLSFQPYLEILNLEGNPICNHKYFRIMAILCLGENLKIINQRAVTESERHCCRIHGGFDSAVAKCISLGWMGLASARKPNPPAFYEEILDLFLLKEFDEKVAAIFDADADPEMYGRSLLHWVEDRRVEHGVEAASKNPPKATSTDVPSTLSLRSTFHSNQSPSGQSPFGKLPQLRGGDPHYPIPPSLQHRDDWNFNTEFDKDEGVYDEMGKRRPADAIKQPKSAHDARMKASLEMDADGSLPKVRGDIYHSRKASVGRGLAQPHYRASNGGEGAEEFRGRQLQIESVINARSFLEKFKKAGNNVGVFSEGFVKPRDAAEQAQIDRSEAAFVDEMNAKRWQAVFQRRGGEKAGGGSLDGCSSRSSTESPVREIPIATGTTGAADKDSLLLHSIGGDALLLRAHSQNQHQHGESIFVGPHSFPSGGTEGGYKDPDTELVAAARRRVDRLRKRRTQMAAEAMIAEAGGDTSVLDLPRDVSDEDREWEVNFNNVTDTGSRAVIADPRLSSLMQAAEEIRELQKEKQAIAAKHFHGVGGAPNNNSNSAASSSLANPVRQLLHNTSAQTAVDRSIATAQFAVRKPALLLNQSESRCLSSLTFSKLNAYSLPSADSAAAVPSPFGVASSIEYLPSITLTINFRERVLSLSRLQNVKQTQSVDASNAGAAPGVAYAELSAEEIVDIEITPQVDGKHSEAISSASQFGGPALSSAAASLCSLYHYANSASSTVALGRFVDAVGVRLSFANGAILELVPVDEMRRRHVAQGIFKCIMLLRCGEDEIEALYKLQHRTH